MLLRPLGVTYDIMLGLWQSITLFVLRTKRSSTQFLRL